MLLNFNEILKRNIVLIHWVGFSFTVYVLAQVSLKNIENTKDIKNITNFGLCLDIKHRIFSVCLDEKAGCIEQIQIKST